MRFFNVWCQRSILPWVWGWKGALPALGDDDRWDRRGSLGLDLFGPALGDSDAGEIALDGVADVEFLRIDRAVRRAVEGLGDNCFHSLGLSLKLTEHKEKAAPPGAAWGYLFGVRYGKDRRWGSAVLNARRRG